LGALAATAGVPVFAAALTVTSAFRFLAFEAWDFGTAFVLAPFAAFFSSLSRFVHSFFSFCSNSVM
jgi:hypothetical protein